MSSHDVRREPGSLRELLVRSASEHGEAIAVDDGRREISYRELLVRARDFARRLRSLGLGPGDRVGILLPNGWPFAVAVLGSVWARAIVVPLEITTRPKRLLRVLRSCQAKALVGTSSFSGRLDDLGASLAGLALTFVPEPASDLSQQRRSETEVAGADELVSITYTSGSTGEPKGVVHNHRSWILGASFTADHLGIEPNDRISLPLPLAHAYTFRHLLAALLRGATAVLRADLLSGLEEARLRPPQGLVLVPDACGIVAALGSALAGCRESLKFVSVGTAALRASRYLELRRLFPRTSIHLPYGLTEARVGFLETSAKGPTNRIATVAPGIHLRLLDDEERRVPPGDTGEIHVIGEAAACGYWSPSDARLEPPRESGIPTGDLGLLDEDGRICLLGRIGDVVKVSGRKVDLREVEDVLRRHPDILDSSVRCIEDLHGVAETSLEAMVVPRPGSSISAEEVVAYCREHLEPYKLPAIVSLRSRLEKSGLGKPLRSSTGDEG